MSAARNSSGFDGVKSVHIIGVCGTLMGAFAAYLMRSGIRVTGSDQNVYPPMSDVLRSAGVTLFEGYRAENITNLSPKPDLIVIGNVISASNAEAQVAIEKGFRYTSLPEAMEQFLLPKSCNLVVAGTHGKTTTSSLLAHVLNEAGKDPSWFIGGVSHDLPHSFHVSTRAAKGAPFVLEGDEYDTAFWDKVPKFFHYLPDHAILTSVEFDHADIYADLNAVIRAFEGLFHRIRKGGHVIACTDFDEVTRMISKEASVAGGGKTLITYGSRGAPEYLTTQVRSVTEEGTALLRFSIEKAGKVVAELALQIPGNHNAVNATAVWIEAKLLGIEEAVIARALRSFRGVKRRQEVRADVGGILVIDDFAHHPTAVRETLKAFRARYPERRLVTVFEPRSATSRRKVFQKEYAQAFELSDVVLLAQPYDQSKIPEADQFSSAQLVDDLKRVDCDAALFGTVDEGVNHLAQIARTGDVLLILSNGGFGGFIPKLIDALRSRSTQATANGPSARVAG